MSGVEPSNMLPNAVSLVALVVVEPSVIAWPPPVTPMVGVIPTPLMAN